MNVAVLLQRAWAQLGPEARDYPRITDEAGRPMPRARRTLFTRIFDPETKYAVLNSATIDDPRVEAAVLKQVADAAPRLERTVAWHRALRDAYYRLPRDSRFYPDPVERLLAPAWEQAEKALPPGRDDAAVRADEVVAGLRDIEGPLTSASLRRVLADPGIVAAVEQRVAEAWITRDISIPDAATDRRLRAAAAALAAVIVPRSGTIPAEADKPWHELRTDTATGAVLIRPLAHSTPETPIRPTYGLSNHLEPTAPSVLADPWTEDSAGEEFPVLDSSLQRRLQRILAGNKEGEEARFPDSLTARGALDRAADLVALPLSLGSAGAHAVFLTATVAYTGLGAQNDHSGVDVPRGAARYLATRFRRAQGVAAVLEWEYGGFGSSVIDFVANPVAYALGRLWVRLARTDFDGREPDSAADAWGHILGAMTSTSKHVHALSKRITSRHVPSRDIDAVIDTAAEPIAAEPTDADEGSTPAGDSDRAWGPESVRIVLRHATRVHGPSEVEGFLAALVGGTATDAEHAASAAVWEDWATGAALARAEASAGRTTFAQQVAALPSYAQVRARVRPRRPAASVRTGIGTLSVGPPEEREERS